MAHWYPVAVTSPHPRIRPARAADIDAIRYVGTVTWPPTYGHEGSSFVMRGLDAYWSAEAISAAVAEDRVTVAEEAGAGDAVAEEAGDIVGMVEVDDLDRRLVMWKLYVVPTAQGRGIGRALVDAAKAQARRRGCDLLTEYEPGNAVVAGFYAREGFVPMPSPGITDRAVWLVWRNDDEPHPEG